MVSEPVERFLKEIFNANLLVGFLIRLGIHIILILLDKGTKKIEVFATFWCPNFALRVREMLHQHFDHKYKGLASNVVCDLLANELDGLFKLVSHKHAFGTVDAVDKKICCI